MKETGFGVFRWNGDKTEPDALKSSMVATLMRVASESDLVDVIERTLIPLLNDEATATATQQAEGVTPTTTTTKIPLRTIYWFVTNYAKKHAVSVVSTRGLVVNV